MNPTDRAVIFGEDAARYDLARPGYPQAIFAHVRNLIDARTALEIGAGTGKATVGFADGDLRITCLEPSAEMAEVLISKDLPKVSVEISRFEEWNGKGPFDLIFAAQSWHWVDRDSGFTRARRLLTDGGLLALLWNVPVDRYRRFVEVYDEFGPEVLAEDDERIERRDSPDWLADLEAAGFHDPRLFVHPWSSRLSAREFRQLCSTYSDHILIPEPRRSLLLDALESAVTAGGGWFDVEYEARAFTGRR